MHREAKRYSASTWKSGAKSGDLSSGSLRAALACAVQMAMPCACQKPLHYDHPF